jgi:peptide/nickel transport system permease protein
MSTQVLDDTTVSVQVSYGVRGNIRRVASEVRRLPIIPVLILLIVLVVPTIFADIVAPHKPLISPLGLKGRLEGPVWSGAQIDTKKIVERVRNNQLEISLSHAQGLREGVGVGETPVIKDNLALGDTVEVVRREAGTSTHILGSDKAGRDVFSRIIHGSRVSMKISLVGIGIGGFIGVALGLIAGYFRGFIDHFIMRLVDISLSIPAILLALSLAAALGPSFKTIIIVVAALLWAVYARQVRGDTLAMRERDFIARARVSGCSHFRIIVRHIFPNITNTLIVLATLQIGLIILLEASLSFLGVGLSPPTPAWGLMVADGRELIVTAWWVAMFPGVAIMLTVLSLNLLGDWLRDRLDPRLRQI